LFVLLCVYEIIKMKKYSNFIWFAKETLISLVILIEDKGWSISTAITPCLTHPNSKQKLLALFGNKVGLRNWWRKRL